MLETAVIRSRLIGTHLVFCEKVPTGRPTFRQEIKVEQIMVSVAKPWLICGYHVFFGFICIQTLDHFPKGCCTCLFFYANVRNCH